HAGGRDPPLPRRAFFAAGDADVAGAQGRALRKGRVRRLLDQTGQALTAVRHADECLWYRPSRGGTWTARTACRAVGRPLPVAEPGGGGQRRQPAACRAVAEEDRLPG